MQSWDVDESSDKKICLKPNRIAVYECFKSDYIHRW